MSESRRVALALFGGLLAAAVPAQLPFDYVVVSELDPGDAALHIVEPSTRHAATVRTDDPRWLRGGLVSIAQDPADPTRLYVIGGLSTSVARPADRLDLKLARVVGRQPLSITGVGGVRAIAATANELLLVSAGATAGLWSAPHAGGPAVQLVALQDAHDVAVLGGKAYVTSYLQGGTSIVVECDLATRATRTVAAVPGLRALGAMPQAVLLGGTDGGDVITIDPVTGTRQLLVAGGKGPVIAVTALSNALPLFATAQDVWSILDLVQPLYTSAAGNRLFDIAAGVHDQAAFFTYGEGCQGALGRQPQFAFVNLPTLGNAGFALGLSGGVPRGVALLVAGFDRMRFGSVPLPFALDFAGMPGCALLTDVVASAGVALDASGGGRFGLPIPNDPGLVGAEIDAQWFAVDPGANPAGFAVSEGAVAVLR